MTVEHSPSDDERIVAAVHDELARWGIDRFDVGAMAHRHGLDVEAIQLRWPDPEVLILEALAHRPGDNAPPPDTGSLRTDLFEMAVRMATMVTSADGRKLHGGHLIGDVEIASMDVRRSAWLARAATLDVVFERARQRGEISDAVDSHLVLELLFAPINMRALYTGMPVDDDYCTTIADMVYRAISSRSRSAETEPGTGR
ncbi:TetR-like C-terminal domain-containing protein [Mycolicibacterium sp. BiH015]|uniref:TetR-like C-terminal domain-containing protein n=1 Tax=Mycolicibacterium sp. BiH015 TaxID=3018808 RepID=UPI0022E454E1|nr:TetR-like C-terminal domain-containing protein [Mycolicibacterium sp. BiH015]MDA2891947.1 TetR-like C-terminal domain-containing protein [Mycolicibacterium sp. BiH015]